MLAALLLSGSARAIGLWVDPDRVDLALEALRSLWPEGPIEVMAAPMPEGSSGMTWNGSELVFFSPEETFVQDAPDIGTAILLARTFLRTRQEHQLGWIPSVRAEIPEGPVEIPGESPKMPRTLVVFGMGGEGGSSGSRILDGARLTVAAMTPEIEYGLTTFIAINKSPALTEIEHIIGESAGQVVSTSFASMIGTAYASWDFGAGRQSPIGAEPRALLGAEVRDSYARVMTALPSGPVYENSDSRIDIGPIFAIGADLWIYSFGIRALAGQRVGYLPELNTSSFLSLDLVLWIPTGR